MANDNEDQLPVSNIRKTLDSGAELMVTLTKKFSETAEKGVGIFLPAIGAAMITVSIFLRINFPAKGPWIGLTEFIFIFIGGILMIAAGAVVRLYVFYSESNIVKKQQQVNGDIMKDALQKLTKPPDFPKSNV